MSKKIGLVLEGGGMRGLYTAGVLDALIEKNIEFDGCIGVSAGSCHGASFMAKQKGRAYRTATDYIDDWRYCSLKSWIKTGDLFGGEFVYKTIPEQLDPIDYEGYANRKGKFYVVCSNIETGEADYIEIKDIHPDQDVRYIRASSSLPLLSKIVEINGKKYLDGGITDSIPILKSIELGYQKNVVILTQSPEYRKKASKITSLFSCFYPQYPSIKENMKTRHTRYNQTLDIIEELKDKNQVFVIQPQTPVKIGRIEKDKEKLSELYQQGYLDGLRLIPQIKKFMKED